MRRYFLPFIAALSSFSLSTHAQTKNSGLQISKLKENFYVYTTYEDKTPSNSMYIVTNKGVVMIDIPWDFKQLQPLLDSIEAKHHQKVVMCIATHFHDDRTRGLNFLKEKRIKTYSSALTLKLCKEYKKEQAQYVFNSDTTFVVGNYSFQTYYPGWGHSEDNIIVWFNKDEVLYGGCFIKSTESPDLGYVGNANIPAWQESITKVMGKFPNHKFIIPGHFSWASNNSLEYTQQLLKR